MAGVIDDNGVQWERCNGCTTFVKLDDLGYEPVSTTYKYGRDLCIKCVNALPQKQLQKIRPAKGWLTKLTKVAVVPKLTLADC